MDDKDFKKHLRDLVHGHHHPEEHDWMRGGRPHKAKEGAASRPAKRTRRTKRPAK